MELSVMEGYYYSSEHEWAKVQDNKAKIGITDYAQQKLGDITYVDPPEIGKKIKQFDLLTGIESVKAASDLYSPLSGFITAFNADLEGMPELVNKSPYGEGWVAEIEISDANEVKNLMDAAGYKKYIAGLE